VSAAEVVDVASEVGPCGHRPEYLRVRTNGVRDCARCRHERLKRRRAAIRQSQRDAGLRTPLVYATRRALDQAARLLPAGTVLENEVTRAITEGCCTTGGVLLAGEVFASATRHESPSGTGRKAWLVTGVRRTTTTRREPT
jgi:hypothetical protein